MEMLLQPVDDASAWTGADLAQDESWIYHLTSAEVRDLEATLRKAIKKGLEPDLVRREDFELSVLGPTLSRIGEQIEFGRGLALVRGLPIQGHSVETLEIMFAGVVSHLGKLIVQNTRGTLIDRVTDLGLSYDGVTVRGYTTNAKLTPHCDSADLAALYCVRQAKSGGINNLASAMTIYNEILKYHPELLEALYLGFHYHLRGGGPPGKWANVTRHRVPIYSYFKGRLSCRYNKNMICKATELPNVGPLTDEEQRAVDLLAEIAMRPDIRLDIMLVPGELLLLNNNSVLHTRESFIDHSEPDRKRLLLRAWIHTPIARELEDKFADHYNTGARQGPHVYGDSAE